MNGSQSLQELVDWAKEFTEGKVSDFDIHCAIYWYAADYHVGQGDDLYEALSCSPYSPALKESGPTEEAAQQLYGALIAEFESGSIN
jgi:hypothetical protein